jgi:uncharacterized membrane protein YraQ (UPF0718 family)
MATSIDRLDAAAAGTRRLGRLDRLDRVVVAIAGLLATLAVLAPGQAWTSLGFALDALAGIAPWFLLSILMAAGAKATGADRLVARAFAGAPARMIVLASLVGALSPFCSCGVIPLIAGLLAAGVPLAPVMAFWLASPLMDPNQFLLLTGTLGLGFALAKTAAAVGIGLLGGTVAHLVARTGALEGSLKVAPACGCGARKVLRPAPVVWAFWREPERAQTFLTESGTTGWFLLRWLSLAFLLESLMVAWVPAELIASWLGGGVAAIPLAVVLGVPAYLNGFAAIPLVSGLIALGMSPAAGLGFMVAGGVTSVPAAIAVAALVRWRIFALYLAIAAVGSLAAAYGFAAVLAWA